MKSYCLRQHKILKLHLLFITIVVFLLSANVSYGDIFVELVHVDTTQYPTIQAYVIVTDENGNLKSREEILQGCANWLKSWSPDLDDETALKRAEHYMKAMPEWADK